MNFEKYDAEKHGATIEDWRRRFGFIDYGYSLGTRDAVAFFVAIPIMVIIFLIAEFVIEIPINLTLVVVFIPFLCVFAYILTRPRDNHRKKVASINQNAKVAIGTISKVQTCDRMNRWGAQNIRKRSMRVEYSFLDEVGNTREAIGLLVIQSDVHLNSLNTMNWARETYIGKEVLVAFNDKYSLILDIETSLQVTEAI
ncbi:MAG: hypothetical protein FWE31_00185 [Firmicutes bacterium]|nr:hypothetical protein [Bacillota bacterium]